METLSWHTTMRDYYWELMYRNVTMGVRIDPYADNNALAAHINWFATKHSEYSIMRYDRLGLR